MTDWRPLLPGNTATPLYRRLADAIAADVARGALAPGTRLPTHRDLADLLKISIGVVTRGYEEAARRGLVEAHVGRGTFVAGAAADTASGVIDISINTAPTGVSGAVALAAFPPPRRAQSWSERLRYLPPAGLDADRRAAAAWLARSAHFECDWRALICCSGTQGAMALALGATCRPGDTVLCESVTFSGIKTLAAHMGYRLHGVDMDGEGMLPGALDRAAAATGARAVYVLPTLQNPTARTAGRARRADLVKVARARDLRIVEDDVYALYARDAKLPPLAALAPERTFYASSLSKTLAPGLRAGFLVTPPGEAHERAIVAVRALMHSPAGIDAAVATHWIESGRADEMAQAVLDEVRARVTLARDVLRRALPAPQPRISPHLWLPMAPAEAERVAGLALRAGLRLSTPGAHAVAGAKTVGGLRLCVGAAPDRSTLQRALAILKDALAGKRDDDALAAL